MSGRSASTSNASAANPSSQASTLSVDVVEHGGSRADWQAFGDVDAVIDIAAQALAKTPRLKLDRVEATIALSTDAEVAKLNGTFRSKPKPTNVLSFPAPRTPTPRGAPRFLGDVILAVETITREAQELDIPPKHHLQHLVIHGLLHLLGYDHETDEEAAIMERLETEVLATLDVADPYAEPA